MLDCFTVHSFGSTAAAAALLAGIALTGCRQEGKIQGRCVQGGRCTEYYRKTKAELDAARGVCRLFTGDMGWYEDGSLCPDDGLVATCRIAEDGDVEVVHYYDRTVDEAAADCDEHGGEFEPA